MLDQPGLSGPAELRVGGIGVKMKSTAKQQHGFTTIQMVATIAIIAIVSTFGVLGVRTARAEFRLQNSARLFASYVEKARADAIRRHAADGQESLIETDGPGSTSYRVTMDWGNGFLETRTFDLESGLSFNTAARTVAFNWRGRISEAWVFQIRSEYLDKNLPVDVSGSGDITVGEQHFPDQLIPDVEISQVIDDVATEATPTATPTPTPEPTPEGPTDPNDPNATPTPTPEVIDLDPGNSDGGNGGGNGNGNPTPTPTPTPTVTPTATPTPTPSNQCSSFLSPSTLSLSQSDTSNQSGSATFMISNATGVRTISATLAGNGNSLNVGLSLVRMDGNGSSVITVSTKNGAGNRGVFIVNVSASPSCGSTQQLTVSVSN
jgi:hypothetical protein